MVAPLPFLPSDLNFASFNGIRDLCFSDASWISEVGSSESMEGATGGAEDFMGATDPLVFKPLTCEKTIVLVRHGLSTWNEESRVQVCNYDIMVVELKKS